MTQVSLPGSGIGVDGGVEGANEEVGTPVNPARRFRRPQATLLAIALILLVALIALWLARKPLAGDIIDRELSRRGVPARYGISDLGLGRQRLTGVVIGDPRHPDLIADWLETRTRMTLSGPVVTGVRAGGLRLRGRLVDGRVSLGALDRLMGPPSGKPFALPALDVVVEDGRIRLDTPYGPVGFGVSGRGVLNDGFTGRLAAIAPRLAMGDCVANGLAAPLRVRIVRERPTLTGPLRLAALRCADLAVADLAARVDATFAPALDHWQGRATLGSGAIRHPLLAAAAIDGQADFSGDAKGTAGRLRLAARRVSARSGGAERVTIAGRYLVGRACRFDGRGQLGGARIAAAMAARLMEWGEAARSTPVGPVVRAMAAAVAESARRFAADMALAIDRDAGPRGPGFAVRAPRLTFASASGGRLAFADGTGLTYDARGLRIDTRLAMRGGGLPALRASLRQDAPGAPIRGTAEMARYAAGGGALAFDRMMFQAAANGETQVTTRLALSGPVGGGRIDGLVLPVALRWDGGRRLLVNPECRPLAIDRLVVSGLRLDRVATRLCPLGGALVRLDDGRIGGGARLGPTRLAGRIGGSPLALSAATAMFALADRRFTLTGVESRIGRPESPTRIDAATLLGRITPEGLAGRFTGGAGQIGQVPLLLGVAD